MDVTGAYDNVTMIINTPNSLTLTITGDYNTAIVKGGRINLDIVGNYNKIYIINATVTGRDITGFSDIIT
ncbi:MAG: hypothetical protein ACP5UN_01955 [Candidatus Micrarchaeia archaeon]